MNKHICKRDRDNSYLITSGFGDAYILWLFFHMIFCIYLNNPDIRRKLIFCLTYKGEQGGMRRVRPPLNPRLPPPPLE